MFNNKDFERRFNRMRTFTQIWFAFTALIAVGILVIGIWTAASIANDPAQIGRVFGEVVKGYKETAH